MTNWPELAAQEVVRPLPTHLSPGDERLFAHEVKKQFGPTQPRTGPWDFAPDGLLLRSGSGTVDPLSFQGAFPSGWPGAKVRIKGYRARFLYPKVDLPLPGNARALVITDEFSNGYFHWVAEALPKLWWIRDRLDELVLILPSFGSRYPYMSESLALWPQLRVRVIPDRTVWALADALVLPSLAPTGNFRPALSSGLAAEWRSWVNPAAPFRKLYISRAKAPWRKVRNEDSLWASLEARGFERVFLEDLSFEAQVRLLAETKLLVSNHGAGLTNLQFMVPGTQVLEIRLRGDGLNNCYFSLAAAVGVRYAYLLADPASGSQDSHTADLIVDPQALGRIVEDLL